MLSYVQNNLSYLQNLAPFLLKDFLYAVTGVKHACMNIFRFVQEFSTFAFLI